MDPNERLIGSSEEETTAPKVFNELINAWMNEKYCPELLKHQSELVDCMMDQIQQMEENLQSLSRDDFRLVPHQMEVDRIRYVISSYLRVRLEKIETFTEYLLKRDSSVSEGENRLMSDGEFDFAGKFLLSLQKHFHEEAIKYMPTLLRDSEAVQSQMEVRPNLNSTVFIRMVETKKGMLICDQVVDLLAGSRHLLPYKDVKHLIASGSALLI